MTDAEARAVAEIVDTWLARLPESPESGRKQELLDAYRTLGIAVIRLALGPRAEAAFGAPELAPEGLPGIDRALALVTAVSRRSGRTIAHTLEDVGRLAPSAVAWIRTEHLDPKSPSSPGELLRKAESLVEFVNRTLHRLVQVMEGSAMRAQFERQHALASMTDVLSHELRNRLGAARTASELLRNPDVVLREDYLSRAVDLVCMSVDDALRTVDDVRRLAIARIESGSPRVRPTGLGALLRAVVDEFRPTAYSTGVELIVADDHVRCQVDASRLRLILFNLIGNGIKYHDPDKRTPRVWVETEWCDDGRAQVRVRDNGVGIAEDQLADIFLYRVRGDDGSKTVGSGLGLAIAREATDQIRGDLSVRSALGEGTTFTLVFPPVESSLTP